MTHENHLESVLLYKGKTLVGHKGKELGKISATYVVNYLKTNRFINN